MDDERSWWGLEKDSILAALADHYSGEVAGEALIPPREPADLRTRFQEAAPRLTALTERIRRTFDEDQPAAVMIPKLGLNAAGVDEKRKGTFALAVLLGDPTANIPFDNVLWDVKNKSSEKSGHASFSESDRKAVYHTDSASLPIPEHFFFLYAVRAANCGGGISLLRDGRILKQQLEQTSEGREAVRVLSQTKLPKRMPEAFRKHADVADDGNFYAPVISDVEPMWRWREKGLRKGLAANPEYDTPEVRQALTTLTDLLDNGTDEIRTVIPTDGILIVDNHNTLHGRTAFTDPERHLLRLRFHKPGTL
ncbi:TauD/TfdA family dioxygenase [Pseudonocardia sp. CA-142604]|uniref:TauD/TfdA family dioxygenase n=1 Tax=Pseudonocardia sp. CA-142604 TaxID=3240024 RepID=UPI003D8B7EC7